jgi:hypothetical protein
MPVTLMAFDLLYVRGWRITGQPLPEWHPGQPKPPDPALSHFWLAPTLYRYCLCHLSRVVKQIRFFFEKKPKKTIAKRRLKV